MTGPGAAPARASKELPLRLHGVSFAAALVLSAAGLAITLTQVFNVRLIGFRPISTAFHALVIGLFGVIALVAFSPRSRPARRVFRFDWVLTAALAGLGVWLASSARTNQLRHQHDTLPFSSTALAALLSAIVLQGVRRTGETGTILLATASAPDPGARLSLRRGISRVSARSPPGPAWWSAPARC
jgi:hypothetical protein